MQILDRQEPEMLLRNCIYRNDATGVDDMNRAAVCILGPLHAKTMVEILFKGIKSNNYKVFSNTITTLDFLLTFLNQYSEPLPQSVLNSYPSNSEECIIATALYSQSHDNIK